MIQLTEKKLNKIKEELNIHYQYSMKHLKEDLDKVINENIDNNLITFYNDNSFYKNIKIYTILQYLYSHIDEDGNLTRIEDLKKTDELVNKYEVFYKSIEQTYFNAISYNRVPLFFVDVDNTLTNFGVLSEEKASFIRNFPYKDHIILSTGKVSKSIEDVIVQCGLEHNYYSCLNGSVIVKDGKMELINQLGVISEKLINELKKTNLVFIGYYENEIKKIVNLDDFSISMLQKYNEWYINDEETIDYNRIVKLLIFIKDDKTKEQEINEKLVQDIIAPFSDLQAVRTAYQCYEILRKDQHKGNSVKAICERLHTFYRRSIGIGDSMNDYPMLTYTGKSFIVSTSSSELKSHQLEELYEDRELDIVLLLKKYSGGSLSE